jgi:hypothetical protein
MEDRIAGSGQGKLRVFYDANEMRKSDVNPLGAALPQSFLRRKKSFLFRCFLYDGRF